MPGRGFLAVQVNKDMGQHEMHGRKVHTQLCICIYICCACRQSQRCEGTSASTFEITCWCAARKRKGLVLVASQISPDLGYTTTANRLLETQPEAPRSTISLRLARALCRLGISGTGCYVDSLQVEALLLFCTILFVRLLQLPFTVSLNLRGSTSTSATEYVVTCVLRSRGYNLFPENTILALQSVPSQSPWNGNW